MLAPLAYSVLLAASNAFGNLFLPAVKGLQRVYKGGNWQTFI